MGAHLLGQACRPLSCPRFGPRPVRVSAGWLRLCAECHWLYVSHHNCFTGSVEIRAWIERTQQVFTHVKFLTEFLERALVRKAVEFGHLLEGPRNLSFEWACNVFFRNCVALEDRCWGAREACARRALWSLSARCTMMGCKRHGAKRLQCLA
jgi:hypothetical protein